MVGRIAGQDKLIAPVLMSLPKLRSNDPTDHWMTNAFTVQGKLGVSTHAF